MADFLADDWFAAVLECGAALPARDGMSADLGFEVAGGPGGKKLRASASLADGQLTEFSAGKPSDAACTIVIESGIARDVLIGELDPAVAYMRGDIKVNDAYELVIFDLQPLFASGEWKAFMADVVKTTTFTD